MSTLTRSRSAAALLIAFTTSATLATAAVAAPSSSPTSSREASSAPQRAPKSASAAPGSVFKLWGPQYMETNRSTSLAEATQDSEEFDLITAKPTFYGPYMGAMRQANPSLKVLGYVNASMSNTPTGYPRNWYVYGADGKHVRTRYDLYMMDIRKPGWIRNRSDACRAVVVAASYDGCILDILGPGPVLPPFPSGQADREPIDSRTGKPWTIEDWMQGTMHLSSALTRKLPELEIHGNGTGTGVKYFEPSQGQTSRLSDVTRSMAVEGFLRVGRAPIDQAFTESEWQQDIAMVSDAESKGHELLLMTKVWASGSPQRQAQWHEYSMGSYLLAAGGRTRWIYSATESRTMDWNPWWDKAAQLGAPNGPYLKNANGLYERGFAQGRVVVNPTERTISQSLGGTYRRIDDSVISSVTLPPKSASVLFVQ